jgi:hypothetical protein
MIKHYLTLLSSFFDKRGKTTPNPSYRGGIVFLPLYLRGRLRGGLFPLTNTSTPHPKGMDTTYREQP